MNDALAWTLIHFLWQGAALGVAAFIALRVVRPERAATRYLIGVATLGLMLATALATFTVLTRQSESVAASGASIEIPLVKTAVSDFQLTIDGKTMERHTSSAPLRVSLDDLASFRPAPLPPTVMALVVTLWALGVFALSLRLLGGWMLTRRLAHQAVGSVSPTVLAAAKLIAERLALRRAVAIVESSAVVVPTLVGYVKPVVLLPAVALSGLSPEQLQAILAHELAHVRRHDYLINLLQSIVETLLFYHPATWWVSAQVRAEREHCCDDLAVEVCGDRLVYVSALAELTSIANHRAFALAATDGSLVGRVQRLLGRPRSVHQPAPVWAVLALFVLIAGSIGSFSAMTPDVEQRGQTPEFDMVQTPTPATVENTATAERAPSAAAAYLQRLEADRTLGENARLNAEAQAIKGTVLKETAESAAFFSAQWFRGWFDSSQPPVPPAPPAPPAPQALHAPHAPEAPEAPEPPEPPAPPEPPDPPDPAIMQRGSGNMTWHDGTEKVSVKWDGEFRLSDDEKDVAWMADGARLSISDGLIFAAKAELRGTNGRIERSFTKNGFRRDWEPEGRQFLAGALDKLIRHSGVFAKDRVARFLKQGGPDAVLKEIDRLSGSSYVRRVYYSELTRQAELSDPVLTRILQRVPNDLTSDYDKGVLYRHIIEQPVVTDSHRAAVARGAKSISSNYELRRTLAAVMNVRPLSEAVAAAVLDATTEIDSNYDRGVVLRDVAERGGLTPATSPAFMKLVQSMSSSYEQRRVLMAATAQGAMQGAVGVEAIRSTSMISSSHDRSETLINLVDRGGLNDGSAEAFFQSAGQISSSYDLSRVLRKVVAQPSMTDRILEGVLRTATEISSSHDRANLLEELAARARVSGRVRELYLSATRGMGSHDSNRALAALVRAEVRQ